MNILAAENLSKSYNGKILFENISLAISEGDKIGLIGINGTGKTTLLKVLGKLERTDTGETIYMNGIKIEYLSQNPEFEDNTTVLEQIFKGNTPVMLLLRDFESTLIKSQINPDNENLQKKLILLSQKMDEMDAWEIETRAKNILMKLGISNFNADVKTLSGGQRKRVAIAGALITPADLLILDEPTNHIDNDTVDWLEKYLKTVKGALLIVTHDRYFLDRIVNRIIELDSGKLYSYKANYSKYLEIKIQRDQDEKSIQAKKQALIRSELEWIRTGPKARSTKQKARIDRFEKLNSQTFAEVNDSIEIQTGFSRLGKKIISLENITKKYPCGIIIDNFSYNLLRDDRVGIVGKNGSGKTTLLKIAAEKLIPDFGIVDIGQTVKIGYFSQENEELNESLRAIEYIREEAEYIKTKDGEISASMMLERFLFPGDLQWTPISRLSGGEKRRLVLLRILMGSPNVLMLDEPTNDLDIQTLTILEDYLEEFSGAVIVVSHDRYFLDRVTEKIFAFEENGSIKQYSGNYSDYIKKKPAEILTPNEKTATKTGISEVKEKALKFTYSEQKEFEKIDEKIENLEVTLSEILKNIELFGSDYEKLMKFTEEKAKTETVLEHAIERWTYLNEKYEKIRKL